MAIKTGSAGANKKECGCIYAADGKRTALCGWHTEVRQWLIIGATLLAVVAIYSVTAALLMYFR